MIERLFMIGLALIPFTAIPGLPFLGELRHELSAHLFFAAIGLSVFSLFSVNGRNNPSALLRQGVYGLPQIFLLMLAVIAVSFIANFPTIKESSFQGRSGIGKFASSTILIFYGFSLATLTYALAARTSWGKLIVKPLAVSVAICAAFSVVEIAGQYNGAVGSVYKALSSLVHGGIVSAAWDTRLRSVASEPPDFANTAGYIWPWLLAAAQASRGTRRLWFFGLWLVLNVMIVLSEARTSLVVVSGLLGVFLALRLFYLPLEEKPDPFRAMPLASVAALLFLPVLVLLIAFYADDIVNLVVMGDRVSNLSRLASMTAALQMFADRPFFGFGFGQFGFHVTDYMPSWGFLSYEIREWLFQETGYWPAVYSVYARFGADMGIAGVLMWIGLWLFLARAVWRASRNYRLATGELPFAAYPLIMSCFCVLLAGIPNDSIRAPMIWINMGLVCRYLHEMRLGQAARVRTQPEEELGP